MSFLTIGLMGVIFSASGILFQEGVCGIFMGCYEVTLNVWSGNTSAEKFYEKMGLKTKERQMEYIL